MLRERDYHIFEYIHHMYFEGKKYEDLPFRNHVSSGFRSDVWVDKYFQAVFEKSAIFFKNKIVLDIGCEIGSKISWIELFDAKEYVGIDPDKKHIYYAKIIAEIVNLNTSIIQSTAEHFVYEKYDTGLLLSVTQHLENQEYVISSMCNNCDNVIIDTWVNCRNCKSLSEYISLVENNNMTILLVEKIKNNRYTIIASKDKKIISDFWSLR